jgi:hypothetical protein
MAHCALAVLHAEDSVSVSRNCVGNTHPQITLLPTWFSDFCTLSTLVLAILDASQAHQFPANVLRGSNMAVCGGSHG